ncbi:oxygenase [Longispora fulva]|uniref:2-polyprenyl-6-methoxyphenol hydroxylase-like FAD-dependent oxidoreductase n=1 Tax=Longispora fulva TaxID=619741 RepID=A0A8J7GIV2_9ACTN|nr:FAD-dependent monooxygenase [Longispora fulva]MBG6137273.1 2-polyprenyl-6-methoxyphenol hydroxylase-like FAD-dependent oxidoreductase [Longispora fulva]GIG61374.1 oxygenase [Longispora fulva]
MGEILVVGAGPTGLTMAAELARHGAAVRIVDRATAPATTSRALVVQPRTLELFDDLGVVDAALAAGTRADSVNLVFDRERRARIDVSGLLTEPETHTEYPWLFSLSQHETERVLTDHLASLGVGVERGVTLTGLTQDPDGVTALLDGRAVRFDWVVGCDGARSAVRTAIGMPFEGATYAEEFIMADARLDWELPDGDLYVFPSRSGFLAAFAMPGAGRFRIFGNVGAHGSPDYSEPTHEEFQTMLDERLPLPARVVEEYWVSRYRLHRRGVPRYRDGRVFLVGDAAHVHSPAGAQGMNTGIQDAYNLAWKLARACRGPASDSLLDSYHAERHPVGQRLLRTTDRMFSVISGQGAVARFARGHVGPVLARRVLGRESVRRWLIGTFAQLRISYPDSPLNARDGGWRDGPAPGDRAREASLGTGRVYDVLRGTHHTVLLFGEWTGLAARIEETYRGRVVARVVGADETAARVAYGVSGSGGFVIRPDKYIAYRADPLDPEHLLADLAARL